MVSARRRVLLHPARAVLAVTVLLLLAVGCAVPTGTNLGSERSGPATTAGNTATKGLPAAPTPTAGKTTKPAQTSRIVFEVNGTGNALTIDYDAGTAMRESDVRLPWRKEFPAPEKGYLMQVVVVVAPGSTGCRILVDGKVVDEQPTTQHCTYTYGA